MALRSDKVSVLVVGAGPTGLTAALHLSEHLGRSATPSVELDVVDKRVGPCPMSRAIGILPASLERLRAGGVATTIEKIGMKMSKIKLHRFGSVALEVDFKRQSDPEAANSTEQPRFPFIMLPQDQTEEVIADALKERGVPIQYNKGVQSVESNSEFALVRFSDNTSKRYDWVIAADGKNSTIRQCLGIGYPGYDLNEVWSIADVEVTHMPEQDRDAAQGYVHGEGKFAAVFPIGQNPDRVRVVSTRDSALSDLEKVTPLKIAKVRRSGTFSISVRQASTCVIGRVLLAGDAAHCHSPVLGRGMNLGIEDAVDAAETLLSENIDLEGFNTRRHERGQYILSYTEKVRKNMLSTSIVKRAIIGFVVRGVNLLLRFEWFKGRFLTWMSEL